MQSSMSAAASTMAESFLSGALVVPVVNAGMSNPGCLCVASEFTAKSAQLRTFAENCMRTAGHPGRAGDMVDGLLKNKLSHDLWYMALKDGSTVILISENLYRQLPEQEIVEQVHKEEVECAVMRGEAVPQDLLNYYRGKSRAIFSPASVQ